MQLREFLPTVPDLTPQQMVDAAKAHTVTVGRMIEATTVNGVATDFKLISIVKACADNPQHPAHDICLGVYTGLLGNHPFNFIVGTLAGDRALAQLAELVTYLPEHAVVINQFRDLMLWLANTVTYPLINTTLHDVLIELGQCPTKPVTAVNGWVTITTNADCPAHRPQLHAFNSRTEQWQRVNNFGPVSTAGVYDCQVPDQWRGAELAVDDPYGAIA